MHRLAEIPQRAPAVRNDWRRFVRTRPKAKKTRISELCWIVLRECKNAGFRRTLDSLFKRVRADFGELLVSDFDPDFAIAWCDAQLAEGKASSTARKNLDLMRSPLFARAVELGLIAVNPIDLVPKRALPSRRPRDPKRPELEVLELVEVAQLLADERIPWDRRFLWALLLFTGARPGEAFALTWGDYSEKLKPLGELVVARSFDSVEKSVRATKTELVRHVPVHPELRGWLQEAHRRFRQRAKRVPGRFDLLTEYKVPKSGGQRHTWYESTALDNWRADLELVGIAHPASGPRRLYAARHTFITLAIRAGADWRALEHVTHNPEDERYQDHSAFGRYVHFGWKDLCAAVAKLELPKV
jgi:integrase